jgi:hypothetical protein
MWGTFASLAKAVGVEQERPITADVVVDHAVTPGPGIVAASVQSAVPISVTRGRKTFYSEAIGIDPAAYEETHRLRPRKGSLDRLTGNTIAIGPGTAAEGYPFWWAGHLARPGYRGHRGRRIPGLRRPNFEGISSRVGGSPLVREGRTRHTKGEPFVCGPEEHADPTDGSVIGAGYKLGSTVKVALGNRRIAVRVVAIMPETLDVSENFFIPRCLLPSGGRTETLVKLAPGGTLDGQSVLKWAAARGEAQHCSNADLFAALMELAGIFSAVAVVNAVVMSTADRRQEFTLSRLAGMTRRQVLTVAVVESGTVVVVGVLLGSLVAAAALAGIAAGPYGLAGLAIPWRLLGLILRVALVVVGVAAALSAGRATSRRLGTC